MIMKIYKHSFNEVQQGKIQDCLDEPVNMGPTV